MRKKLIELLDDIQRFGAGYTDFELYGMRVPDEVFNKDVADHLLANGVTIQPAVPGPEMGHDMAERCYRNGEEAMREKVIDYLREQKGITMGAIRSTLNDAIEKVRKL